MGLSACGKQTELDKVKHDVERIKNGYHHYKVEHSGTDEGIAWEITDKGILILRNDSETIFVQ